MAQVPPPWAPPLVELSVGTTGHLLCWEKVEADGSWWAWVSWAHESGGRVHHKVVQVRADTLGPAGATRRLQRRAAAGARPGRADPGCELTGSQPGQCWRKRRHHQLHVLCVHAAAARWPLGPRPIPDEERRRRTRSDRIAGSQMGGGANSHRH